MSINDGLFTCISNLSALPAVVLLWKRNCNIESHLMATTALVSTLYHISERGLEQQYMLDQNAMHAIDYLASVLMVSTVVTHFLYWERPHERVMLILSFYWMMLYIQLEYSVIGVKHDTTHWNYLSLVFFAIYLFPVYWWSQFPWHTINKRIFAAALMCNAVEIPCYFFPAPITAQVSWLDDSILHGMHHILAYCSVFLYYYCDLRLVSTDG